MQVQLEPKKLSSTFFLFRNIMEGPLFCVLNYQTTMHLAVGYLG